MQLKKIALLGLLGVTLTSQAALFDDKEARKKILQVEEVSLANDREQQADLDMLKRNQADIETRLSNIENMLQNGGGLVEIQNQIEALKQELAQLRGDLEVATHNLETTQQRQKDLYTDTDTRLRRVEGGVAPITGESAADAEEVKQFGTANSYSEDGMYKEAFAAYDGFLRQFPDSQYVPDALYGMGYAQFALKNYKSSIVTQQKLLSGHPDHTKAPNGMYSMANSQIQLGQVSSAKKTLRTLIKRYPAAEVVPSAKKRLKMLEAL